MHLPFMLRAVTDGVVARVLVRFKVTTYGN